MSARSRQHPPGGCALTPEPARRAEPTRVVVAPRTLVTFVGVALGGVLLLALAYAARSILVQLTVAIMLAMALEPLVQALEQRGLRRSRAVGAAYTAVLLALAGFAYFLIPPRDLSASSAAPSRRPIAVE